MFKILSLQTLNVADSSKKADSTLSVYACSTVSYSACRGRGNYNYAPDTPRVIPADTLKVDCGDAKEPKWKSSLSYCYCGND